MAEANRALTHFWLIKNGYTYTHIGPWNRQIDPCIYAYKLETMPYPE